MKVNHLDFRGKKTKSLTNVFLLDWGREVKANFVSPLSTKPIHAGKNTVAYEARYLKALLLDLLKLEG